LIRQLAHPSRNILVSSEEKGYNNLMKSTVTKQKHSAIVLKQSEGCFKDIFNAALDGIFIIDIDNFCIVEANPQAMKLVGYDRSELIGMPAEKIHPQEMEQLKKTIEKVLSGTPVQTDELTCLRKDHVRLPAEISFSLVSMKDKSYIMAMVRDITERQRAEEKIKSLAKFPSENPNPVLRISKDGTIIYANDGSTPLLKALNCAVDQVLPKKWLNMVKEIFDSNRNKEIEVRIQDQVFLVLFSPIIDSGYICVYGRDITDRIRAQEKQQQLKRQNELILNSAGEGIYGLDNKGLTTFVNPAAAQMLGWESEELLGKPQHAVIHHTKPDGSAYHREDCPIYAAFKDGAIHRVETEVFWRKDGSSFPVEYVSTPILEEDGKLAGAVVTFIDITERKRAQEALQSALSEVKQLKNRLQAENIYLQDEIKIEHSFGEIVSSSAIFKKVLRNVEKVASTNATVLILGETGTGKELIARAVHNTSDRRDRPLVKVNCAALPESLIESELFGHEKGAFTGAFEKRIGRFELADKGTIFLDEIGDLPLELQTKLLRVLQEGEFERLGNPRTMKVDVRVIAATNRDLAKAAKAGDFREDLYYRLNVFPINCPALRERKEDIPMLVKHFCLKYGKKIGKDINTVPQKVLDTLKAYHWPGNIRELENIVERAIILSSDSTLDISELPFESKQDSEAQEAHEGVTGRSSLSLKEIERGQIHKTLEECHWVVEGKRGAAVRLDIAPSTLRERMQKYGIKKPL